MGPVAILTTRRKDIAPGGGLTVKRLLVLPALLGVAHATLDFEPTLRMGKLQSHVAGCTLHSRGT
jgi:hypothetical protein